MWDICLKIDLIIKENYINFDKKNRPKDRVEFRTTCNKETRVTEKFY